MAVANLFERLGQQHQLAENLEKERQVETIPRGPLLQPIAAPQSSPTEKLLDWLVNRWPETTVSTRNIMQFGPGCLRDRKSAMDQAKILTENGWLTPIKSHRYDRHVWQIIRGPSQ